VYCRGHAAAYTWTILYQERSLSPLKISITDRNRLALITFKVLLGLFTSTSVVHALCSVAAIKTDSSKTRPFCFTVAATLQACLLCTIFKDHSKLVVCAFTSMRQPYCPLLLCFLLPSHEVLLSLLGSLCVRPTLPVCLCVFAVHRYSFRLGTRAGPMFGRCRLVGRCYHS
jgi:succinate dehydrogenase hydrophobic anchor subunit